MVNVGGLSVCKCVAVGVGDGLCAVSTAGLGEDAVDVGLHGGFADEQPRGDLGVGQAGGNELEDLGLALGQAVGQASRREGLRKTRHLDEAGLHGGIEDGLPCRRGVEGSADMVAPGILGQVADRARA